MSVAAGWYPDPSAPGGEMVRWWDGARWTDRRCPAPRPAAARAPAPEPVAVAAPSITPSGLVDADRLHLIECYVGAHRRVMKGAWEYQGDQPEGRAAALLDELARQLPPGEPPLALWPVVISEEVPVILVAGTARRLIVLTAGFDERSGHRVEVESDALGQWIVEASLSRGARRGSSGVVLLVSRSTKREIERFLTGPQVLEGDLQELLDRPRRSPGAPVPDWYPDPGGKYAERFWDGAAWTEWIYSGRGGLVTQAHQVHRRPLA